MNRRVSDLMDYIAETDVEMNMVTPLSSQRIKEITMRNVKKANPVRRIGLRLLIAAAILSMLAVTAVAAERILGAGDYFADILYPKFGSDMNSTGEMNADIDASLSAKQIELMNEIGKVYNETGADNNANSEQRIGSMEGVTCNGTTMTPVAVIADEEAMYLYLRIDAPEDIILADLDPDVEGCYQLSAPDEYLFVEVSEGSYSVPEDRHKEKIGVYWELEWLQDTNPEDNTLEVIVRMTKTNGVYTFIDEVEKWITFHGLWIQSPNNEYTQILDGDFCIDISLPYESKAVRVDCKNLTIYDYQYDGTMIIEELEISPLSMRIQYSYQEIDREKFWPGFEVGIILKNGSLVPMKLGISRDRRGEKIIEAQFIFDIPVLPEDIDYILINETYRIYITDKPE